MAAPVNGGALSRARANMALSFSKSVSRDLKRTLRNASGTIPFFDFDALKEMFSTIFADADKMRAYFEGPVKNDEPSPYGLTRIENPFHVLDCGLCMFMACYVETSLNFKFYSHLDFQKIHANLQRHLTVAESISQDCTSLAAYKLSEQSRHSYWVVNFVRGYGLVSQTDYAAKLKTESLPTVESLSAEPTYEADSPPVSRKKPTPMAPKKPKLPRKLVDNFLATEEADLPKPTVSVVLEPSITAITVHRKSPEIGGYVGTKIVPHRGVLSDSDSD
jgi:hypothetical protein